MATKSIFKDITIKDKKLGRNFVLALENAQNKSRKEVVASKSFSKAKGEQILKMFGDK